CCRAPSTANASTSPISAWPRCCDSRTSASTSAWICTISSTRTRRRCMRRCSTWPRTAPGGCSRQGCSRRGPRGSTSSSISEGSRLMAQGSGWLKARRLKAAWAIFFCIAAIRLAAQTVYPTGTTLYDPSRAWSGYTVLSPLNTQAVIVIDMNGTVVKQWDGFINSAGGPARVFPGGFVMGANGANPPRQESLELVARDFDGKVLWRFDRNQQIQTRDGQMIWSARQHHDWQREDYPAGYYSPDANPSIQ